MVLVLILEFKFQMSCFFPIFEPLDNKAQIFFHIFFLFIPDFKNYIFRIRLENLVMSDFQNFTINIFLDFLFIVASFLKSNIKLFIVASDKHDKIKISEGEEIRTMKIDDDPSSINGIVLLNIVQNHILIEDGTVEFVVPFSIQFLFWDKSTNIDVCEPKCFIQQSCQGCLPCSRCPSN